MTTWRNRARRRVSTMSSRLRRPGRSTRVRAGLILLAALLTAGLVLGIALGTSGATKTSYYQECANKFGTSERAADPQWLKEKIAQEDEECEHLAAINESISPTEETEAKERFRASHKRGELNPEPESSPVTGIIDSREAPLGRKETFRATNHWTGQVEGQWYVVYAGARTSPEDGAPGNSEDGRAEVLVYHTPDSSDSAEPNTFVAAENPSAAAERTPLTIIRASGGILTLETDTGAMMTFDVATHSFG